MRAGHILLSISLLFSLATAVADGFSWSPEKLRKMAAQYEQARGVERDYDEAYRLYCIAALQEDPQANYSLGWMYFNGRGLKYDLAVAMGWFDRAANFGDGHAKNFRQRFPKVVAKADKNCRLPEPGRVDDRKKIAAWVQVIAPQFGMDPNLVMAVIDTESGFNSNARSPKNAQGLMQLIPSTAKRFGVRDPWDPIENIVGGIAYLHWLTRHFSGDLNLVLAGYNAGEGAVEKYRGIPPYRETQRYVKKITGHYRKTAHPVPVDLGEVRNYAVQVMTKYSSYVRSKKTSSI